ncbi:Peptidyl-prolyl cis-trans isomerase E [Linum perenne]
MAMQAAVQKNTLYVGGLAEEVNESILHAAFIPFGDIKDVKTPLDQATQKHRSFGFVTFLEKEDASSAMDNMDGAELYGRVLTVNYALPEKIKGGEQGWAAQPSSGRMLIHGSNASNKKRKCRSYKQRTKLQCRLQRTCTERNSSRSEKARRTKQQMIPWPELKPKF